MQVEIEVNCNECGTDVNEEDCYCSGCYQELLDLKNDLEEKVDELEGEIKKLKEGE